ncbi:hypothetical protein N658DRAFT_511558 [Parathielavia hyrcaniae]|uniref:Uncharacterized protein n=1 Tax=Parathielavia hyrcaniae TaxID=113614 RepID=A0AAN6PVA6_9PEZI|nr:hypothetical protein N658DRAFT_511558 [Parathielavia hyrcaniae]
MGSEVTFDSCYQDMRGGFPAAMDRLNPLNLALVTRLPFPNGVVPEWAMSSFSKASGSTARRNEIANSCANSAATDSLIILVRLFLALGINKTRSRAPKLFDLAFHEFGRNQINDYIVKGKLLDTLYPQETARCERIDAVLGDLIRHPLVRAALWSHPELQFYKLKSWTRKSKTRHFKPSQLGSEFVSRELPFQIDHSSPVDLGAYFSKRVGIQPISGGGGSVAVASLMPSIIPVIVRGGRPFHDIRSFVLDGPVDYDCKNGAITPVKKTVQYHLRAVANLADSDIRIYHQDTSPVIERIRTGFGPDEYYSGKLRRGEHVEGWTFEDSPLRYFLLIYARYCPDTTGGPYKPPSDEYGEYLPVLTGRGEQRLSQSPYTADPDPGCLPAGTFF